MRSTMDIVPTNDCGKYGFYENALLEGIKEAVKILKDEQTN